MCFVTGQGTLPEVTGEIDVDEGRTTLLRTFDLSQLRDATVSYWL